MKIPNYATLFSVSLKAKKELLVIDDGYRQSEASWKKVLLDLKTCMLKIDPQLAIGDGALG